MQYLGLFKEGSVFKLALVKKVGRRVSIDSLRSVQAHNGKKKIKPLLSLHNILKKDKHSLVSGLSSQDMIFRKWELKLPKNRPVHSILPFQIEKISPYPSEETIAIPQLDRSAHSHSLFATSKGLLDQFLGRLESHDVFPDVVSCQPVALLKWAHFAAPELQTYQLIYVGLDHTFFMIVDQGAVQFTSSIPSGTARFIEALSSDKPLLSSVDRIELAKKIDLTRMSAKEYPELAACVQSYTLEMRRLLAFASKKAPEYQRFDLMLTGHIFRSFNFEKLLNSLSEKEAISLPKTKEVETDDLHYFAVPIGLALDAATPTPQSTNFLFDEYTSLSQVEGLTFHKKMYAALGLVIFFLVLIGNIDFNRKTQAHIASKLSRHIELDQTNREGLFDGVSQLENQILKERNRLILSKKPRLVSEFLLWLTESFQKYNQGEGLNISITKFHYTLPSKPTVDNSLAPYKVLVEMEFVAETPLDANRFKKLIIGQNRMVDNAKKIGWETNKNRYTTNFFLK